MSSWSWLEIKDLPDFRDPTLPSSSEDVFKTLQETHIPSLSDYPLADVPLDLGELAKTIREPFLDHTLADFREYTPSPRIDSPHSSESMFRILEEMHQPRTEGAQKKPEPLLPLDRPKAPQRLSTPRPLKALPPQGSIKERLRNQQKPSCDSSALDKIHQAVMQKVPEDLNAVQKLSPIIKKLIKEAPFTKGKSGPYPHSIREFIFIANGQVKHSTIALICTLFNVKTNRHCIKKLIYKEFASGKRSRFVEKEMHPVKAARTATRYLLRG